MSTDTTGSTLMGGSFGKLLIKPKRGNGPGAPR
jgi:hypothetical protein